MKVSLARAMGTCFGVDDAIEMALSPLFRGKLTVIGQLVHNPQTVERLKQNGIAMVNTLDDPIETPNVMITAHGAPESTKELAQKRGFNVYDASCPLVLRVHAAVAHFVSNGYHPVVIGEATHVEVKGIVGDLEQYTIVGCEDDIDKLEGYERIGIVCQTTQQSDVADRLVKEITERFPEADVRFKDTICKPTKDRQLAVRELADQVDLMLVIGGKNSSNTKKLKKVCVERGVEAFHIEGAAEIDPRWFVGKEHVGITAGTSTPHSVIDEVYRAVLTLESQRSNSTPSGEVPS